MGTKGTGEHIPNKELISPVTKVPLKKNCLSIQKIILRKIRNFVKKCGVVILSCDIVFMTAEIL